jgi:hypothetical protein
MNTDDKLLEEKIARNAAVETWGGYLVLVGLILETVYAYQYHEPRASFCKAWGPVVADAAVFVGVWVEIHFNGRASKSEAELKRLSNERVALANERAATAELAAAEARERVAEIEKLTAWRRLTSQQKKSLAQSLTPHASSIWVWIEHENGDTEAFTYARDIAAAIFTLGLRPPNFSANSHSMQIVFGVVIEDITPGQVGLAAFRAAGIPYDVWDGGRCAAPHRTDAAGNSPNLYIWVGPKLAPALEIMPQTASNPGHDIK